LVFTGIAATKLAISVLDVVFGTQALNFNLECGQKPMCFLPTGLAEDFLKKKNRC